MESSVSLGWPSPTPVSPAFQPQQGGLQRGVTPGPAPRPTPPWRSERAPPLQAQLLWILGAKPYPGQMCI